MNLVTMRIPAIVLAFAQLVATDAFVQPLFSAPFLSTAFANLNPEKASFPKIAFGKKAANKLFSTTQEVETGEPSPAVNPAKTQVLADVDDFVKPTLDTRSYRSIRLPNNLQALLVSDPETDVEAGAVHIKAGHFDDPEDRAGLAHFNEHMLFLGTEKYPQENDFETFVGKNGGTTNAYTDMEDTNYYFSVAPLDHDEMDEDDDEVDADVDADDLLDVDEPNEKVSQALAGGLDRFAQFFIAPLFRDEAVERELRAINSEHLNSFTSESWRNYQLLKSSCVQTHPFSKFGCGDYNTLTNGGNITGTDAVSSGGSSPVPALKEFWNEKYVAEHMKVCVVGRADLDELQKVVEKSFAGVRSNGKPIVEKEVDPSIIFKQENSKYGVAFGPAQLGLIREYVPLEESRSIKLLFATPPGDDPTVVESRPDRVLNHLLGHESPGSLHSLLLEEGLINDLSAGTGIASSDFSLCSLSLQLTPKGMAQRDYVLSLVWQYINLVKSTVATNDKVMEEYHDELRQIASMHFRFQENGDPTDFCSGAAELLFDYEPQNLLVGSSMPGPYNATVTKAFLDRFRPDNCIVNIKNPDFEQDEAEEQDCSAASAPWQFEKWYRAKYRQVKIKDSLTEKWTSSTETDPRLYLPGMNTFLPTDFSLRSEDPESIASFDPDADYTKEMPKLLLDRPGVQMWHKMDRTFNVPKTSLRMLLTSPTVYRSPRTMSLMRIFVKILEDDLNSFIYDATMVGCNARVACLPSGLSISVSGYSEKLPQLLNVVTRRMLSIIDEMKDADESSGLALKFEKATKNLLRETKNFRLESPHETASYSSRMLLEHNVSDWNPFVLCSSNSHSAQLIFSYFCI